MEKQIPERAEAQKAPDQPETAAAQLGQIVQAAAAGDNRRPLDLDAAMRERMEQQFGLDFSAVRLEESSLPGRLGADAVAQGDVIRFAPGAYRPDTPEGERLLSHELGHLVRQSRGMDPAAQAGLPFYDPIAEHAADDMAFQAASGGLSTGSIQPFSPVPAAQAPMEGNRFTSWIRRRAGKMRRSDDDGVELDDLDAESAFDDDEDPRPGPLAAAGQWFSGKLGGLKQRFAQWGASAGGSGQGGHEFNVLRNVALQRRAERRARAAQAAQEAQAAQAAQQAAPAAEAPAPDPAETPAPAPAETPAPAPAEETPAAPGVEELPPLPAETPAPEEDGEEDESWLL